MGTVAEITNILKSDFKALPKVRVGGMTKNFVIRFDDKKADLCPLIESQFRTLHAPRMAGDTRLGKFVYEFVMSADCDFTEVDVYRRAQAGLHKLGVDLNQYSLSVEEVG